MRRWLVKRPNDEVIVTIMKNKCDETYSFINLTKEHICPCNFNNIDDALIFVAFLRAIRSNFHKQKKE